LDTLFTLGDMKTPLLASFVAYGTGSILIAIWYKQFGILGITYAMIIANLIYFKIMMFRIISKLKLDIWPIISKFLKNLSIAVLSGIIGVLSYKYLANIEVSSRLSFSIFNLILPSLVILSVYLILA
jgi:Na+-driven multidrug efflux pump